MTLDVRPLCDALGAAVHGLDLSQPVSDRTLNDLFEAWYAHLVLIIPGQELSNAQHVEFSRHFGTLEVHPNRKHVLEDNPEILLLTNRKDRAGNYVSLRDGGSVWHSDLSYMREPSMGSLLYAIEVPVDGGDTEWANMYLAYDALPADLKECVTSLTAVHQFDQAENPRLGGPPPSMTEEQLKGTIWTKKSAEVKARTPDVHQPVVRTHPATGRRAIFVNRRFTICIDGMEADKSEELLLELFDYAEQPEHIYRHRWTRGDLVMWDNRCTIHLACGGVPEEQLRTMQRTTVRGEIPV